MVNLYIIIHSNTSFRVIFLHFVAVCFIMLLYIYSGAFPVWCGSLAWELCAIQIQPEQLHGHKLSCIWSCCKYRLLPHKIYSLVTVFCVGDLMYILLHLLCKIYWEWTRQQDYQILFMVSHILMATRFV